MKTISLLHLNKVGIIVILSIFSSCQPAKEKEAVQEKQDSIPASTTGFKPNPQKVAKVEVKTLAIGTVAPDFKLPDVSGKFYTLEDFKDAKVLVMIFTCNHCPTAQAYEDRIIKFTSDYKDKGVSVVAVMPNSTMGLLPEECGYTDLNDSYEEMIIRHRDKKYNFPYLYDGDTQSMAIAYGPVATPHAYVFDADRKLAYVGRIDNIEKPGKANAEDLRAAVDALLEGKPIATPENKTFGCSVKWEWKGDYNVKVEKEWKAKPVALEKVKENQIKDLVKNSSGKLRLINLWATWCAPCVAEYPDLVQLQRWYGHRDFEFVSLSADKPEHSDKALAFLKKVHSPVKNYIYDGEDNYKLIEAVDPKWNGALPYTLLVEPGGKIVYSYQGPVDLLELKRAIVEHPLMGRFY
jgi:thiol-disulfide isomerase/thioredoxin